MSDLFLSVHLSTKEQFRAIKVGFVEINILPAVDGSLKEHCLLLKLKECALFASAFSYNFGNFGY